MLAYSSIAHAGYLLCAFAAAKNIGISAAIFYAASYAVMNAGTFIVIAHFASHNERYVNVDDYAGLGRRAPGLAAVLTIFLLSLIGIPLTGGFFAKFYVFSAALQSDLVGLTIIGVEKSTRELRALAVAALSQGELGSRLPGLSLGRHGARQRRRAVADH